MKILRSFLVLFSVRDLLFSTLQTTSEFSPAHLVDVPKRVLEVFHVAQKLEDTLQPVYTLKGT